MNLRKEPFTSLTESAHIWLMFWFNLWMTHDLWFIQFTFAMRVFHLRNPKRLLVWKKIEIIFLHEQSGIKFDQPDLNPVVQKIHVKRLCYYVTTHHHYFVRKTRPHFGLCWKRPAKKSSKSLHFLPSRAPRWLSWKLRALKYARLWPGNRLRQALSKINNFCC